MEISDPCDEHNKFRHVRLVLVRNLASLTLVTVDVHQISEIKIQHLHKTFFPNF